MSKRTAAAATSSAGSKRKSTADDAAACPSSSAPLLSDAEENRAASSSAPSAAPASSSSAGSALSAAAASAPNPHLASVIESASAAAPVAKRTRRAAQSAQAAAAHARASPMMRLLGADSGARQSLLESMDLGSIARLQCTGRSWRGWIAEAPFVGAKTVKIRSNQLTNSSRCPWIRRSVQHIQFEDSRNGEAPVLSFDQLLLLQWSRLRSIKATFHRPLASANLLRASFAAVAATLQRLDVSLLHRDPHTAANLLPAVSSLHQLESLTIRAAFDWADGDLSALPALPRLERFVLCHLIAPPCSLAQVEALAQCKSLTDLQCGQWLPAGPFFAGSAVELTAAQLQQLEDGLGRLWRLRKDNGAAPLRRLYLGFEAMILPQCWRVLSQFTALEELEGCWSRELTAADWMLLANFPQLHSLTLRALESEGGRALLDLGLVLPVLVHCRAFRTLELFGRFDLRTEHAALLAQVPSLESFAGHFLRMESLEPLSHAPALTNLDLSHCDGLNGEPINIRAMVPPMPLVNKLTIHDESHSALSASQAEPFNAALFARLPKLPRERFSQG